jgi:large subunit ribosomal protein L1
MAKRSKKYREAVKLIDLEREYTIEEACDIVGKTSKIDFDASVDIDLKLGVDPRHADQMVRGSVSLPHGTGKQIRVLALVSESKQKEAEEAGADYAGLQEYIDKIEEGWTDIDVVVANPEVMSKIGKLGRILGPRGLMPNPKSGTVTDNVAGAVSEAKTGKIDFRVDRQGNLHASIGRASFEPAELRENAVAFLQRVIKLRPASAKGLYIRNASLSATMGPGIPLDRSSVMAA